MEECTHEWDHSRPLFIKGKVMFVRICRKCKKIQKITSGRQDKTVRDLEDMWRDVT
jgi:hypothetical protein